MVKANLEHRFPQRVVPPPGVAFPCRDSFCPPAATTQRPGLTPSPRGIHLPPFARTSRAARRSPPRPLPPQPVPFSLEHGPPPRPIRPLSRSCIRGEFDARFARIVDANCSVVLYLRALKSNLPTIAVRQTRGSRNADSYSTQTPMTKHFLRGLFSSFFGATARLKRHGIFPCAQLQN